VQRALIVSASAGGGGGGGEEGGENAEEGRVVGRGVDAQTYISKSLVTFRNVEELQGQNQKLLRVVRQLSQVCKP
jgi:hypothetical protein